MKQRDKRRRRKKGGVQFVDEIVMDSWSGVSVEIADGEPGIEEAALEQPQQRAQVDVGLVPPVSWTSLACSRTRAAAAVVERRADLGRRRGQGDRRSHTRCQLTTTH